MSDLSFDDFRDLVARVAGVDANGVDKDSNLWGDLGFDSIAMVELMTSLGELGVAVPDDVVVGIETVWHAYEATTAALRNESAVDRTPVGPLETPRLRLRPLRVDDHPFLYDLATSPTLGWRLRSRGLPMSGDAFVAELYRNVLAQFMVDDVQTAGRVGLVQAVDANLIDGHARLALVVTPERIGTGWAMAALGLFVDYLFGTFPLRKLYAEVPEFAMGMVASGAGKAFEVEGTLRSHRFANGRWWDVSFVAVHRDAWRGLGRSGT